MGVINKFFGRFKLAADPAVTTQSVAVVEVQDTNTSIVLKPNGTGGIIASVPDGTATGGNARGNYSVDLQTGRTASSQVANGNYSSIIGGYTNTASGAYSIAGGAFANATAEQSIALGSGQASATGAVAIGGLQGGGNRPIASGSYAVAFSLGNTASSNFSTVSGGQSNTASTNTHATVVGGQSNTASGQGSISGGVSNTASGIWAVALGKSNIANIDASVALGDSNTASGSRAAAIGQSNTASGYSSLGLGLRSLAYLSSQISSASGYFTFLGDSQHSFLTARNSAVLATGGNLVLSLNGTGTTDLIIPNGNNRAWNVTIDTIAVVTAITGTATGVSVGDCYRETKQLLFKRIGGTSSIVGTVDTSAIKSDSGMSTAALTVTAGASQQMALEFTAPTFAGGGSVTCRVVSKVMLVEVAY